MRSARENFRVAPAHCGGRLLTSDFSPGVPKKKKKNELRVECDLDK